MMRIAFAGKAMSGKTLAAKFLCDMHSGWVLSFANALKERAYALGWDGAKDLEGRRFLQNLGVLVRGYDEDYWVKQLAKELDRLAEDEDTNIFIDDVRFENEVSMLRKRGFKIVYLDTKNLPASGDSWRNHESEQLDMYLCDEIIISTWGDKEEFLKEIDELS